jgi:hypothetical protein
LAALQVRFPAKISLQCAVIADSRQGSILSDLVTSTISMCASETAVAKHCISFRSGKLLSILSETLERATSFSQARAVISLCQCLIGTLCNSTGDVTLEHDDEAADALAPLFDVRVMTCIW